MVVAASYFAARSGHWVAWASAATPLAVVVYATLYWMGRGEAVYEVGPLTVVCRPEGYRRVGELRTFYGQWAARYERIELDIDPAELLAGATLELRPDPPTIPGADLWQSVVAHPESLGIPDVDPDQPGSQAWGLTYPRARWSVVDYERATEMNVGGWELDLLAVHAARGGAPESSDLEWLREHGVRA
jgi:hypothetical protein